MLSLKVPSVGAKLVKIELKSAAIPLSLAEVEVYGSKRTPKKLSNIALTKETRQSSTDYNGFSRLAVDGNKNGDYGHHSLESNNLSIDLKGLKGKKVRISLRNAGIPLSLAEVEVYTYK
ncbi:exported glycosyl hydrolase [Streptococcus pneumoniae]|nr:exported glycosyl hydrolase [Streptococcus pneumoniae]